MRHGYISSGIVRRYGALVAFFVLSAKAFAESPVATSDLVLVGVAQSDGVTYASVVDAQTGERFLPSTRGADGGIELVEITADEDAILRQNGRSFLVHLGWASGTASVSNVIPQPTAVSQNIARPGANETTTPTPPPGEKLPLVFQSGDLKGFNLTDDQKAMIVRLRQQFLASIGGTGSSPAAALAPGGPTSTSTGENPSSPASQGATDGNAGSSSAAAPTPTQVWETAQEQSDDLFKMLFGTEAFNLYEMGLAPKPHL